MQTDATKLVVGSEIVGPTRVVSLERVRWFEASGRWANAAAVRVRRIDQLDRQPAAQRFQ